MKNFEEIYKNLEKMIGKTNITQFVQKGSCACALISENNVYYGGNYKAECGLTRCAEQIAVGNALMNNETKFDYAMILYRTNELICPCGVCRELFAQINEKNLDMKIILSLKPLKTIKLSKLLTNWWGENRK